MIIKGKRGATTPEDETVSAPPQPAVVREPASAIIKGGGAPLPPRPVVVPQKRSGVMKRGSYTMAPDEPPPPVEEPAAVVEAPAADEAGSAASDNASVEQQVPPPPPQAAAPPPQPAPVQVPVPVVDPQIMEDAKRRAEAIVRQAQMDAKKLLEESKVYCQQAQQQAEQEGFEQGKRKGYEIGHHETVALIVEARNVYLQAIQMREHLLRALQPEVAQLALKVAERVTATAVTLDPEIIKNQIAEALERVKDREHITVHVNEEDLDIARDRREMFQKILETPKSFEIIKDGKVERGGCIIETNLGNVDARISTQMAALQVAFEAIVHHEEAEAAAQAAAAAQQIAQAELQAAQEEMARQGEMVLQSVQLPQHEQPAEPEPAEPAPEGEQ